MRRILFVVALLAALAPTAGQSASAQIAPLSQFSGYSTGTAVHAGALESGTTRLVDSEIASSGANVNSGGIGPALTNEMKQAYQSVAEAGDKSAGRGSGLEIGVATTVPNVTNANQINPGSTVQAFAPTSTALLTKEFVPVALDPIVNATTLRGQAQAIYSDSVCVLGQPISSGLGYAANANLVNTGTPLTSLLATNTGTNAVNQSKSFTYLIPNGDGSYGLVTETHQILAPVTLIPGIAGIPILSVEFAGEWVLRSTATGISKPGGAKVDYAPGGDPTSTTKVLTIKAAGAVVQSFTTQEFLSQKGLPITLPAGLGEIVIGEAPRAIGGATGSSPVTAADGTMAAAAVDVLRVKVGLGAIAGITDLRVGHMESSATVPVGGIQCGIPVKKVGTPASVVAGKDQIVNYTITVPADVEAFKAIACDIKNIKVVDVTTAESGVKFNIVSASSGGVISGGDTVTWANLGTYKPGGAPIVLTVGLKVPADSAAGKITDTATATAVLGDCKGNDSANAASLTGLATVEAAALTGSAGFAGNATTLADAAPVVGGAGATPVGGVQTGFGGTSHSKSHVLPIGTALGSIALLGSLTAWRRRRIG